MSFDQYSETPASNYITGYFLTGMAPSSVKVAGSDIMADLASRFAALHTTGGTANAQTLTQTRQFGALVAGLEVVCIFGFTNTGAATFAPDGLTAKNVFANGAAALAGQMASGAIGILKYDGTQWNLLNPSRAIGSATVTLNVGTNTTTGTLNYAIGQDSKTVLAEFRAAIATTSNNTTLTLTNIPAILSAASAKTCQCLLRNNAAMVIGWFSGLNGTTWTGGFGTNAGAFTNAASNGVQPCTMTFGLD